LKKVVHTLSTLTANMDPHPFIPFLDVPATQAAKAYVWNERGNKMLARLQEFYTFVRSLQ